LGIARISGLKGELAVHSDNTDVSGLPIQAVVGMLRGTATYDDLARSIDNRVSSPTLQRMGDASRPFGQSVLPSTLIGAAEAINSGTPNRITPWALWIALGIQLERTHGLWGRPTSDRSSAAAHLLPPGWPDLSTERFATWHRTGAALIAEQQAAGSDDEMALLRARVAELEADLPRAGTASTARRTKRP
jgi:hypothetical protein